MFMGNHLNGFGVLSGITLPATSYANSGGTGNRTASLVASSNVTFDSGTVTTIVNGSIVDGTKLDEPGLAGQAISAGSYIRFDFGVGASKYIDEAKVYMSNSSGDRGNWKWQTSDDALSWTDASASINWLGAALVSSPQVMSLAANTGFGRYYQFVYVSGGTWRNGFIIEFEFKINA